MLKQLLLVKSHLWAIILLLAVTAILYAQALQHEFLLNWDDHLYVTGNDVIRGFSREHLSGAFGSFFVGNYAPLQMVSYMLDYSLWGMQAKGFILSNILLHLTNGILYYLMLIRLTGKRVLAFIAGFIFLVHPVQVESVAWISQRKNLLCMLFFLMAFLCYMSFREKSDGSGKKYYIASLTMFIMALLVKSAAVILPGVLVLYDACYLNRKGFRELWLDKIPFIAIAAVFGGLTLWSQSPEMGGGIVSYHGGTPIATILTMLTVFVRYLYLLLYPNDLSIIYDVPVKTAVDGTVIGSALVIMALLAGAVYLCKRNRPVLFWVALFIVGLLPVAQIVPLVTLMNDRYLYFPMMGVAGLIAWGVCSFEKMISGKKLILAQVAIFAVMVTLMIATYDRIGVWKNSASIWSDAYCKNPNNVLVCSNLGYAYYRDNRFDLAGKAYSRALDLDPDGHDTLMAMAVLALDTGDFIKAESCLRKLEQLYPQSAEVHRVAGNYCAALGDLQGAKNAYCKSLVLNPDSIKAMSKLGIVYYRMNDVSQARTTFQQGLKKKGNHSDLHYNYACVEASSGRTDEAITQLEAAFDDNFNNFDRIAMDQELDSLRPQPRFQALVARQLQRKAPVNEKTTFKRISALPPGTSLIQ